MKKRTVRTTNSEYYDEKRLTSKKNLQDSIFEIMKKPVLPLQSLEEAQSLDISINIKDFKDEKNYESWARSEYYDDKALASKKICK